jgi:hypothetical protein
MMVIHGWLWFIDQDLYTALLGQKKENESRKVATIKEQRLELHAKQSRRLQEYRVSDKRNIYAEIPLERAFDYYLRSLKR